MEQVKNVVTSKNIPLEFPITVGEGESRRKITSVTMSRLKAKHLKHLPAGMTAEGSKNVPPGEVLPLIGALCNLKDEELDEIDFSDLEVIIEVMGDFLGESTSQKTGTK